jgi:hypothetical protein
VNDVKDIKGRSRMRIGASGIGAVAMDRERIETLLRMAHEIERLESEAAMRPDFARDGRGPASSPPDVDHVAGTFSFARAVADRESLHASLRAEHRGRRGWRITVGVTAAAMVGLIGLQTLLPLGSIAPTPQPLTTAGSSSLKIEPMSASMTAVAAAGDAVPSAVACEVEPARSTVVAHEPGFGSRIIAVALDADSSCRCSQTVLHRWDTHQQIASVSRADLLRIGFESACVAEPERILVVAVSGPVDQLPDSDEAIAALAHCVAMAEEGDDVGVLGQDEADYAAAAMACITRGLVVQAATLFNR